MAMSHQILLFTFCSLLLLVILVQCQGYPLLNELPSQLIRFTRAFRGLYILVLERGHKFHSQHDVDRYLNRVSASRKRFL